jgi:hypothetical protein
MGAAVGFLGWLGVTVTDNVHLSRHGEEVLATIEETSRYSDDQYLLSFAIDGQTETQWVTGIGDRTVGDNATVIVDRDDHTNIVTSASYGRR